MTSFTLHRLYKSCFFSTNIGSCTFSNLYIEGKIGIKNILTKKAICSGIIDSFLKSFDRKVVFTPDIYITHNSANSISTD